MDEPSPLEQAYYRDLLYWVEQTFPRYRSIIESFPADDPEAILTRAWLEHWEMVRRAVDQGANINRGLLEEIKELNDSLPGLSSTRPPFSEGPIEVEGVRNLLLSAGYTDEQAKLTVDEACKSENHRPRNDREIAIEALRMHMARASYPRIANALCPEHGNSPMHRRSVGYAGEKRLDACSEKYRGQIRDLKRVLKKYTTASLP